MTTGTPLRVLGHTVHRLGTIASTQAEAARLAADGAAEGTLVTATHQSAGRGRRGREWLDAPGQALLMSLVLRPLIRPTLAPQLSLVAAVAVVDALDRAGVRAAIRWPNDVLVGARKICGMLPEAVTTRGGGLEHVILGIGLNVNQREFPAPIRTLATSMLIETGREHEVEEMLRAILFALGGWYGRFLEAGLEVIRPAWLERAQGIGGRVRAPDGRVGTALGLDADGALLLRTDSDETVRLVAGEVALEVGHASRH